ncbi:hypothetical protein CPB83DRAFT_859105 [Crepidotus variabilis]|uniref:Methyltransferase domain-containing protein n=1 Tax=Crepidotus variabilis TaxID=179855 RepID=A0A9P6JMG3_9AGAR|nr:hypothetical protein CPB83DRAFT_859105 [Crepidotus variabilis]
MANFTKVNKPRQLSSPRSPKRRRLSGDQPYPLTRSREMMDLESCSEMLMEDFCNGLTTCNFGDSSPPQVVLDLGCGKGSWAIKAGQTWPRSTIVGLDVESVQPRLDRLPGFEQLAQRVKWVKANFLETLPFQPHTFDFVRMCNVGLAIPEDEWLVVLEEVRRVMKPGALLECIEDDPIFPAPSAMLKARSSHLETPPESPPSSPVSRRELSKSRSTIFRDQTNLPPDLPNERPSLASRISALLAGRKSAPEFLDSSSPLDSIPARIPKPIEHPQDHTRLKAAWSAMLTRRFLPAGSMAVLLFYLTTSSFNNVRLQHHITVPLPPNSGVPLTIQHVRSLDSLRTSSRPLRIDTAFNFGPSILSPVSPCDRRPSFISSSRPFESPSRPNNPYRDALHLAKTVAAIRCCKEAIWREWRELFGEDTLEILQLISPSDEAIGRMNPEHLVRHTFEQDWRNWEYDMINRQNMAGALSNSIGWQPMFEGKPDPGSYQDWKNALLQSGKMQDHEVAPHTPNDLCRSVRVYIASKT